jgi:hypothetical protein
MTKPNSPAEQPAPDDGAQRHVKSGNATDGETPDDSAPPQDPEDDGSKP